MSHDSFVWQFPNSFTKMRSYCQQNCEKKQEIVVSYLLILIPSCFQGYIFKNVLCLNYYMQIISLTHCLLYVIIVIVKSHVFCVVTAWNEKQGWHSEYACWFYREAAWKHLKIFRSLEKQAHVLQVILKWRNFDPWIICPQVYGAFFSVETYYPRVRQGPKPR